MVESNNKDKVTLPGIIYLDIKNYIKDKKEIRQQKKAENRKIKFREIFIENCKKGYHAVRYRYYAYKENKILQGNSELENVQAKKIEEEAKVLDHNESIQIMQKIREEQKAAKKGEEEFVHMPVEDTVEERQNEVYEPLAIESPAYDSEELKTEQSEVVEQNEVEPVSLENEAPVVEEVSTVEPVDMEPEIQSSLAESAQEIVSQQNDATEVEAILREIEGLGKSVAQVQQTVVTSLASKQRQLDTVTKEKAQLVESNNAKDSEIASLRQQLAEALTAKENAEKEKVIFENQFKDYVANTSPIVEKYNSMVSLMGGTTVQPSVQSEVVNEDGHQKVNRI